MDDACDFLVTCEHGGNRIPAPYREAFAGQQALLQSHRGYDPGALTMARDLAGQLHAALYYATISRLLVDLNRSPGHPRLHAEPIRRLPAELRRRIIEQHYLPYRIRVEKAIDESLASGKRVIHISSHSFTPVLDEIVRNADIGLLYDPARATEAALCKAWLSCIKTRQPDWRVRRNYPYAGKSDGLTAWLRRRFSATGYLGIELEINQSMVLSDAQVWRQMRADVIGGLLNALNQVNAG